MTLQTPAGRDNYLFDLTRWNRAGLSRFQYVDGDAAVWMEEVRIALLGLYLRGVNPEDRTPEQWRDLFMKPEAERQLQETPATYQQAIAWRDLLPSFPVDVESTGARNQRLLGQYNRKSGEYGWEVMRAFARSAHIVLNHQNAYANEGYLRTATQWENLRKLAAMVNYQPTPPASATTTIALQIEPDKGVIEIARGLAMKFAPPEGGAPRIFETLKPVLVHPELNAGRTRNWDYNSDPMNFNQETSWIVHEKAELAQGDPVVVTRLEMTGQATSLKMVNRDGDAETAKLEFEPPPSVATWQKGETYLLTEPDGVQKGLPRTVGNQLVIQLDKASSYSAGIIVRLNSPATGPFHAVVLESTGNYLKLDSAQEASGEVKIEAYTSFAIGAKGDLETPLEFKRLFFKKTAASGNPVRRSNLGVIRIDAESGKSVARKHTRPDDATGLGFARSDAAREDNAQVISDFSLPGGTPGKTVRFEGKPPKSLKQGDWYVARPVGSNTLSALRVNGVRIEADVYYVLFCPVPPAVHDKTEFFGPMTRRLRPVEYDRDQEDAVIGGISTLEGLAPDAQALVKAGRDLLVVYEKRETRQAAQATLTTVEPLGADLKLTLDSEQDFSGWHAGWTTFHLNTVDISHGETKDSKILGSGDAEKRRQEFQFKITNVSHIPSNASVTGVAPDMDVTVDGVKWEFRDIGDPTAEGEDAWSAGLNEDDTLQIHFRRRLPTGTNNTSVSRHRVGVGAKGTGVPGWSFTKPMKKNRFVAAIVQPMATTGGANREPVSDIRQNAPAKLAANGRAVSLKDFERLCQRHASVWQARAREVISPGAVNRVDIVIVPANGGMVGETLAQDLIDFVESRSLPNVQISITPYVTMALEMRVTAHVDTSRYEKSDVKDAVEAALVTEFALNNRKLGQAVYVAEILAAMERVEGVSSATITTFSRQPVGPAPLREALVSGSLAAIFPTEEQVAVLASISDVTVDVEGAA